MNRLAMLFVVLGAACGPSSHPAATLAGASVSPECLAAARVYADALNGALTCDPAASGSCAALRPTPDYVQIEGGDPRGQLDGICNCTSPVNPAHLGAADAALAAFEAKGCSIGACPCPSNNVTWPDAATAAPQGRCSGLGTCH
jgi:hypothetical protein